MKSALNNSLSPTVDIIIPIYRGFEETRTCLKSVLYHPQATNIEIVVIDDSSPDEKIKEYINNLAQENKITLLDNPINRGFVNAVNRGMVLHPDRDVVLLNSDTEVHGNWLDRLRHCAYSGSQIGTVTPFSNNATICSYPRFTEANSLPSDYSLESLDNLFSKLNSSQSLEIPTGVGFCIYITRNCLNQVGYFDASHFKKGYGEENDFCMRSLDIGFRNLLCEDTFVYHKGGISFSEKAEIFCADAQEKLKELHPHYFTLIHDFCTRDPARITRRRVDLQRLMDSPRQKILFITHAWGGGTEKHVQDLVKLLSSNFEILILRPKSWEEVSLEWAKPEEEFIIYFSLPYSYSDLLDFLKYVKIFFINFHHVININQQILQIQSDLELPYDFTLHDYYPICPQFTLTDKNGNYCGEPDATGCTICLEERPAPYGMDILSWRTLFSNLLTKANRVIAPSRDILERTRIYIPNARYEYLPHPEPSPINFSNENSYFFGKELKILILGRLSLMKGLKLLEACAIDAKERQLPLYFKVIGFPVEKVKEEPEIPLYFYGPYDDLQLPSLIERERADIIFFPALWPESYSYTLSEAMRSNLPIVAPRLGAFTERLAEYPVAHLLDWDNDARQYNDFFIQLKNMVFIQKDTSKKINVMVDKSFLENYMQNLPEKTQPDNSYETFRNQSASILKKHLYSLDNPPKKQCVNTLSRLALLKIIQDLPTFIGKDLWTTQSELIDSIQNLVSSNGDLSSSNQELTLHNKKQESYIKELQDEIEKKQEKIDDLNNQNSMHRQEINQYLSNIKKLNSFIKDDLEKKENYTCELENNLQKTRKTLEDVYSSTSWRITTPIRELKKLIVKERK